MAFKKGEKRPAGAGRKKGSRNKKTVILMDMVLNALHSAGGESYLKAQAKKNPTAFMALVGKVLPMHLRIGDPEGNAIEAGDAITNINFPDAKTAREAFRDRLTRLAPPGKKR